MNARYSFIQPLADWQGFIYWNCQSGTQGIQIARQSPGKSVQSIPMLVIFEVEERHKLGHRQSRQMGRIKDRLEPGQDSRFID